MIDQVCISDTLLDAVKEVFETMIFMMVEKASDQSAQIHGDTFLGSITFKGELEGCLGLCLGETCARTVAANMLCLDNPDEVSDGDLADAIGEVANMIMGSVKTRLQGDVSMLEISIPSVITGQVLRSTLGEATIRERLMVKIDQFEVELTFFCRTAGSSA